MSSVESTKGQESFPLVGAQAVRDAVALPYHGLWRVLEASGQSVEAGDIALAGVSVSLRFGYLVLRAPGMLRLDIPLDVIEDDPSVLETIALKEEGLVRVADEGAWATEWFSQVMARPVRLVKLCRKPA